MLITNLIKRTKNKNMVISIHAEKKKVRKNSTPSMGLTLKTRNIRELPQLDNENLQKPTVDMVDTAAKSLQSCPTLCDPIDGSPPGSPSLGFSRQEHEWVAISFSNA